MFDAQGALSFEGCATTYDALERWLVLYADAEDWVGMSMNLPGSVPESTRQSVRGLAQR